LVAAPRPSSWQARDQAAVAWRYELERNAAQDGWVLFFPDLAERTVCHDRRWIRPQPPGVEAVLHTLIALLQARLARGLHIPAPRPPGPQDSFVVIERICLTLPSADDRPLLDLLDLPTLPAALIQRWLRAVGERDLYVLMARDLAVREAVLSAVSKRRGAMLVDIADALTDGVDDTRLAKAEATALDHLRRIAADLGVRPPERSRHQELEAMMSRLDRTKRLAALGEPAAPRFEPLGG